MDELKTLFGAMLRRQRKQCGLSQVQLAEKARLSLETVARLERGVSGASFDVVSRLASALAVAPSALFGVDAQQDPTGRLSALMMKLASLDDAELEWVGALLDLVLLRSPVRRVGSQLPQQSQRNPGD